MITVEVVKFRPIDKGALQGFFDLVINPMGMKVMDCTYFVKGDNKWFNFPRKEVKKKDGEVDFWPIISFSTKEMHTKITEMVLEEIKKHIGKHDKSDPFATGQDYIQGQTPFVWP